MNAPSFSSSGIATLLYVEDEDNDVLFMRRALDRAGVIVNFQTACDGDKAVDYLAGEGTFAGRATPNLVLLDLNLPARSGFEVLEWLRQQPGLRTIPVVIFSSSGRPEDRERARLLGADDYLIKPTSPLRLVDIARELCARWLGPKSTASVTAPAAEVAAPVAIRDAKPLRMTASEPLLAENESCRRGAA